VCTGGEAGEGGVNLVDEGGVVVEQCDGGGRVQVAQVPCCARGRTVGERDTRSVEQLEEVDWYAVCVDFAE
jgi:hypothetical protein